MSVIVGRALPDARDGLKPVQRRILYAMHELGLTPDRPYRKCARVVGDVLGKYHPHGDQAVYDALVRLVQSFSSRYPVLNGHGNFGSVDDDPPAAMRYTETRLAPIANQALLDEIGSETVDFASNFDGSQQEPTVLPAQLPFLLLNGCSGIAVGMATSIPPHNLIEVVDGLIALIKNPELSDEKLLSIIPGPDFPTGGEILIGNGIKETYLKGRGSIPMRGIAHIEEIQPGKGKHRRNGIVITELPFQLSKSGWIEKLAEMVNDNKIGGIADIRDESDRDGMRVLVELRRDTDPEKILNDLHRRTSLQSNFGAILLAIVNGQPKQLSLRELLENFLEYRELTFIRRTKFSLNKTLNRLETLEGLIKALNNLQQVIELIQNAKDAQQAKAKLMVKLDLTEKQSEAVLAMPLRRLTSLEKSNLHEEVKDLRIKKNELEILLEDRSKLLEALIIEFKNLKKCFGNKRKTRLIEGGDELVAERNANQRPNVELQRKQALEALPIDGKLLIQNDYQVKVISPQILGRLHLNASCAIGDEPAPAILIWPIEKKPKLLAITASGRVAMVKWEFSGQQPGQIERFLPGGLEGDKVVNLLPLNSNEKADLGLLSSDGRFKRLSLEDVIDLSGRASTILKLKDGVILKSAVLCYPEGDVILATNIGRLLRLIVNNVSMPIMGKLAQGPMAIRLFPDELIIGAVSNQPNANKSLLLGTERGVITKILIKSIRACERGSLGELAMDLKDSKKVNDRVIDICSGDQIIGIVTNKGRNGRINAKELDIQSSKYSHKTILPLKENELLEQLVPLIQENDYEE